MSYLPALDVEYNRSNASTTMSSMDKFLVFYHQFLNASSGAVTAMPWVNTSADELTEKSSDSVDTYDTYEITVLSIRVILYTTIFLVSVFGNVLALITLTCNRRLQSIMSVFLINLTISDLMLTIFCMPFTLIGSILKNFIFGRLMCHFIPYVQGVSVGVSVWTLVAISVERYYLICNTKRWNDIRIGALISFVIWLTIAVVMSPIAIKSTLIATHKDNKNKCREVWSDKEVEIAFNAFLDIILFIIPLIIMAFNYSVISLALNQQNKQYIRNYQNLCSNNTQTNDLSENTDQNTSADINGSDDCLGDNSGVTAVGAHTSSGVVSNALVMNVLNDNQRPTHVIVKRNAYLFRENYSKRYLSRLVSRRNAIKMLFVLVTHFFVCWSPLYIVNTWSLFDIKQLYATIGSTGVSIVHLLAYCSCFNCYIYCFMHTKFREALLRMVSRILYRTNSSVFDPNVFADETDTQTSSSRNDISMALVANNFLSRKRLKY